MKAWPRSIPLQDKPCVHSYVFLMPDRYEKGELNSNNQSSLTGEIQPDEYYDTELATSSPLSLDGIQFHCFDRKYVSATQHAHSASSK